MRINFLRQRWLRYFATLALIWIGAVSVVQAQVCTTTSDGQISSLLGTDFDRGSSATTQTYDITNIFANTPKDIVILPNSSFTKCGSYSGSLHSYDSNTDHFNYDWLKANNKTTQMGKIYTVTDSLHKLFPKGKGMPFAYEDGQNAFYVTGANPNGFICGIYFPWELFRGRHFQLSYRFYFIQADSTKQCDYWNQPYITVGAHNSAGGYSGVTTTFQSDAGDVYSWQGGGNGPDFTTSWDPKFPNSVYTLTCNNNNWVQPRVDIGWTVTYDINFVNYNTDKFDCLIYYPYLNLSNADNYRVVFDYINVKMEHLCVDKTEACPGDEVEVTAVDFNDDAVVEWQYTLDGTNWVAFDTTTVGTQKSVKVKYPDAVQQVVYRVRQIGGTSVTDLNITQGYSLEVTVSAKDQSDCNPAKPELKGSSTLCAPATQTYTITNAENGVSYIWTLLDPSGNDITTKYLSFVDTYGKQANISLPSNATEGNYTIKVMGRRTNASYQSEYAVFNLAVHPTPEIIVTMTDANGNVATEVCPATGNSNKLTLTANPVGTGDYTYVWTGAAIATSNPAVATLDVPTSTYCDYVGTTPYLKAGVTATRYGCPTTVNVSYPVSKAVYPTINCRNTNLSYTLAATENSHAMTINMPTYSTQCGEEADLVVSAVGPKGETVAVTVNKAAGTLTATFPLGTTTITYTVTDGCNHSVSCTDKVTMVDKTNPNVPCDQIPSYSTKLSYYGEDTCSAYQGKGTRPDLLPVITAPILEDLDHPGEMLTGTFVSRSDKGNLANAFSTGVTTITWKFTDASGNSTTCTSKVTVIDDKVPVVTCPETSDMTFATDDSVCYATFGQILSQLLNADAMATAVDKCHPTVDVVTEYYIRGGEFTDWTAIDENSTYQLAPDINYTLETRFYRADRGATGYVDTEVYSVCDQTVKVEDKENPQFSCDNLSDIVVSVNTSTNEDDIFDYASGAGDDADVTYTLANELKFPTAEDNCSGVLNPVVTIVTPDSKKYTIDGTKDADAYDQLMRIAFPIGSSKLTYTYTDAKGNSTSCTLTLKVVSPDAPEPNCPTVNSYSEAADANCQAVVDWFSLENIPTATVSYDYTNYTFGGGMWKTVTTSKSVTVYPYRITRQHYTSQTADPDYLDATETCQNDAGTTTYPLTNLVWFNTSLRLQDKNFKSNPTCNSDTFALGLTRITYEFRNSAGVSTCVVDVLVKDTTKPSVNCYRYDTETTIYTTPDKCSFPYAELGLLGGHISRLYPTDNCSSKMTLTWYRKSNGQFMRYLSTPNFVIGDHEIGWAAVDEAGNISEYCVQKIHIVDTLGPTFDCESLLPIEAFADENCVASSEAVANAGLITPVADDDPCSPTGSLITGVGTRSDGEDMDADYKLGETVITWTFTDAIGNKTICTQTVTVKDTTKPVFVDCGNLDDLTFNITLDECTISKETIKAALGTHSATDNCGTSVEGVPGLGENGKEPLLDEFPVGDYVVTWVFDDGNGNVTYCTQNISVKDEVGPDTTGICPADKTVDAVLGTCENDLGLTELTINDHCDGALVSVSSRSDSLQLSAPFKVGTTVVTYVFTDSSANQSTCVQNIKVNDVTPPTLECYTTVNDSVEFQVDDEVCSTSAAAIVEAIQEPTAYDECDEEIVKSRSERWYKGRLGTSTPVLVVDADSHPVTWDNADVPYEQGYTDIYYIFTDQTGNSDTCIITVHVLDMNKPKVECSDIETPKQINPDANKCDVDINKEFLLTLNPVQAKDVCKNEYIDGTPINQEDGTITTPNLPEKLSSGDTLNLWWYYFTELGASAKCPQQIYVTDNQKPRFECSSLTTIEATADSGKCSAKDVNINIPEATDNCGNIKGVGTRSDSLALTDPYPTGTTTITWTFSDTNPENDITCEQNVFVKGSVPPEIQCDTIRNLSDTIPDCETTKAQFDIKTPVALDLCAPAGEQNRVGTFVRSDGKSSLTDVYELGNTVITWTFTDFTGSVSSSCEQTINVRTSLGLDFTCPLTKEATPEVGKCTVEVPLTAPVAKHPCLSVTDTAVAYINGKKIDAKNGEINYTFPLGKTNVYWVFTDTTNSLVKESDTCIQVVNVGSSDTPTLDCPTDYADIKKILDKSCEESMTNIGQEVKAVYDLCNDLYRYPTSWLASDSANTVKTYTAEDKNIEYSFKVGVVDTVYWRYIFEWVPGTYDTTVCVQQVWLQDKGNLYFDCSNVPNKTLKSDAGECYASLDSILLQLGDQFAEDKCIGKVPGVPTLENGDPLPNRVSVGDSISILWTFTDSLANSDTVLCHQMITVIGDQPPVYNDCDSLNKDTVKFIAEGDCYYDLKENDLTAPVATDYCTGTDVVGIPYLPNGTELKLPYKFPVGASTIHWVFISKYSSVSSSCDQPVFVKTTSEADTHCDDLKNNSIKASIVDCEISFEDLHIETPTAVNPCNSAPLVVYTDYDTTVKFKAGVLDSITWYFIDTTGFLTVDSVACIQYVDVTDARTVPNVCDSLKSMTYHLDPDDCELSTNELNITEPQILDTCKGEYVVPTYTRYTGKTLAEPWVVGEIDTLYWKFTLSNDSFLVCPQSIVVLDDMPEFDCSKLSDTTFVAGAKVCFIEKDLKNFVDSAYSALAVATDPCTGANINGQFKYEFEETVGWPSKLYRGESYKVIWTFVDSSLNATAKTCEQVISVDGEGFTIACDSLYQDIKKTTDECKLTFASLNLEPQQVTDNCETDKIYAPVASRFSKKALEDDYEIGSDTVYWTYDVRGRISVCKQAVVIKADEVPFDCNDIEPLNLLADTTECAVDTAHISEALTSLIPYPTATPECTAPILGKYSYPADVAANLKVGESVTVTWTFSDTAHFDNDKTCEQKVTVKNGTPNFDCSKLKDINLPADANDCELDTLSIAKALQAINPVSEQVCGFSVPGVYSFQNATASYKLGQSLTVKWTFSDSAHYMFDKVCYQSIFIVDSTAPTIYCPSTRVINVQLTQNDSATFEEVVANGLEIPQLVFDCDSVDFYAVRSDSQNVYGNYPIGETTITWHAVDVSGNESTCEQIVNVIDKVVPTLHCVQPIDSSFACETDVPQIFETFEEFKLAGGSVSDESKIEGWTFAHIDLYDVDPNTTANCQSVLHRTYYFVENSTVSCTQNYTIHDSIAPVWADGTNMDSITVIACDEDIPFLPIAAFTAIDNCSEVSMDSSKSNNRGADPNSCDYYSYDIMYKLWAKDACGNTSDTVRYTIQVRDTVKPSVNVEDDWSDRSPLHASYLKGCNFGVPSILDYLPDGAITDNCQDQGLLKIRQVPGVGDTIYVSQYGYLFIEDLCGNVDTLKKWIYVPQRDSVVKIKTRDTVICGGDDNPLTLVSPSIRDASGSIWYEDENEYVNSTIFFDAYIDYIDERNIIFSNNPTTYGNLFSVNGRTGTAEYRARMKYLTKLHRASKSGHYVFVAMDTLTLCSDTAAIDLTVLEKPRVKLDSAALEICNNDSLPIHSMYSDYSVCVEDMGGYITDEGWMIGDTIYVRNDSLTYAEDNGKMVYYYATNYCGTTYSYNSLYTSCYGYPYTANDSLSVAGSEAVYKLMQADSLYVDNHLNADIHMPYDASQLVLTTDPQDKARVWIGDNAYLSLHSPYDPSFYYWYKVVGDFDGRVEDCYLPNGNVKPGFRAAGDDPDEELINLDTVSYWGGFNLIALTDSASYYVLVGDGVCPATASNLVKIDVMNQFPTAITPYTKDGMNDTFMEGHHVIIFNRYGQELYEGLNGWDGTYRGLLVDPGVYFYQIEMNGGATFKGTIEVVKIK